MGQMEAEKDNLRKMLSVNIKEYRRVEGISQEKLAERTGLSEQLIKDIEGCRSWISDKTLVKLATALQTETYRLFMPLTLTDNNLAKAATADLAHNLSKIRKDFNRSFDNALKSRRIKS